MIQPPQTILQFDAADPQRHVRSREDLRLGFAQWRLAWALARTDIKHRYRGSVLGPFWMTISTAVMILGLGFLYSKLLRIDVGTYLPWLAISLILWGIISQAISDACLSLTSSEGIIRQIPLPYSIHALRTVFRISLISAHSLPLIAIIFLVFGISPTIGVILVIPGLILLAINSFWAALLLGMLCARFRDVPPIVTSVLQLAFFMTPVIWKPELIGESAIWLPLNPFFALMEIVRGPLMGTGASWAVWILAIFYTGINWWLAHWFFTRFRSRIAFWV